MRDFPLKTGGNRAELHYYLIISVATSSWDLRHHQNNTTVHHSNISSSSRHFPWIGREAHRRDIATNRKLPLHLLGLPFLAMSDPFLRSGFLILRNQPKSCSDQPSPFSGNDGPMSKASSVSKLDTSHPWTHFHFLTVMDPNLVLRHLWQPTKGSLAVCEFTSFLWANSGNGRSTSLGWFLLRRILIHRNLF